MLAYEITKWLHLLGTRRSWALAPGSHSSC